MVARRRQQHAAEMRLLCVGLLLLCFLAFQVGANLIFRYGAIVPGRWWLGFLLGNLVGVASITFFMGMQRLMPDRYPLILALGSGGAFLAVQVSAALVFRQPLGLGQHLGIAVIVAGMAVMLLCQPEPMTG